MKFSPLLMCLLFGLAACQSNTGGDSKPKNKAKTDTLSNSPSDSETDEVSGSFKISKRRKVSLDKDFSKMKDFKENINNYIVTFEVQAGNYSGATVECKITSYLVSPKDKKIVSFDDAGLKAEIELSLDITSKSSVDYDCKVIDRETILDSAKITLKKSIVVPTGKTQNINLLGLGSSKEIESLVLEDGAVLVTGGEIVNLKMNEFISNKGTITTFANDNVPKALDNEHGKSGGVISIETEKAVGEVSIELKGGNAGIQTEVPTKNPYIHPRAMSGQCRGVVQSENFYKNNQLCWGKNGYQGLQGLKGFRGFNGGSTGILSFHSTKKSTLKLKVNHFPGQASKGGIGGEAGSSGLGGIGSTIEVYKERIGHDPIGPHIKSINSSSMYKYPDGKIGIEGLQGEMGDEGSPGKTEISKINFNMEEMTYEFNYDFNNF